MEVPEEILKGCKRNDQKYQESLYKLLYVDLIRIGLRYLSNQTDAEDVLNRTMFKVFSEIRTFRGTHLNFGGWIKRIFINEALDMLRSKKSFTRKHVTLNVLPDNLFGQEVIADNPEHILKLLDYLPNKAKTVFNLYVIEGYKHQEISELLDISVANSKWNLHLARKKMQTWIIEKELI